VTKSLADESGLLIANLSRHCSVTGQTKAITMVHVGLKVIVQKYLGNCQESSVIKLGLGVNKSFFLQLLGQKNCQTFWYLFYFGKMRLSISKTKIFSDR
jgi:hypothetical protein